MLAAAACRTAPEDVANGDDPIAALAVPAESRRYTSGFWREQARADTAPGSRWSRAIAYCGEPRARPGLEADGAKPNCHAVRVAAYERREERARLELRARTDAVFARMERMRRDPAYARRVSDSMYNANRF